MSARCVVAMLGGDPVSSSLPDAVPEPLANVLRRVALTNPTNSRESAWDIRTEIGKLADHIYGAPQFIPIVMPS
jgi:hypothetical protein